MGFPMVFGWFFELENGCDSRFGFGFEFGVLV